MGKRTRMGLREVATFPGADGFRRTEAPARFMVCSVMSYTACVSGALCVF